jgi:hypothetical protein
VAKASGSGIKAPSAARQVRFHQLLVGARKTWLMDALSDALATVDPERLKTEILHFVPKDVQQILAASGIRDERVFPLPAVLEAKPTLVGYYRLLLGSPQKTFYGAGTGMGPFKRMETAGIITQPDLIPAFCETMAVSLADLVRQVSPRIESRDVAELPLLTFGSYLQGQNNTAIGKQATQDVFLVIADLVKPFIIDRTETRLKVKNASKRTVTIALSSDPDVAITEVFGTKTSNKVAIEIKGGTDKSNAHNRAGEAEKSHQKAAGKHFKDFWTIIALTGLKEETLATESPTTNNWFDASHVLARSGAGWEDFKHRIAEAVGIPLAKG